MNFLRVLGRPEYVCRPSQLLIRMSRSFGKPPPSSAEVTLPWGATIRVNPEEYIGSVIWHRGVFDLIVLEAIARLVEAGETALDVGANIGQMTSLMCHKVGKEGVVIACEPHPQLFSELKENLAGLEQSAECGRVILHQAALSNSTGSALLDMGGDWKNNRGLAKLAGEKANATPGQVSVPTMIVDDLVPPEGRIGVWKLDVEGHELKVLEGARRLLKARRIRDVVFEDLGTYPTRVQQELVDAGFTLFSLHSRLRGPFLETVTGQPDFDGELEGANFLATLDPTRALARFAQSGWQALR